MNRLKKEIRRRGVKLESDYPYLPYEGLEAVHIDSERAIVSEYYSFYGWLTNKICPDLSLQEIDWACDRGRLFG